LFETNPNPVVALQNCQYIDRENLRIKTVKKGEMPGPDVDASDVEQWLRDGIAKRVEMRLIQFRQVESLNFNGTIHENPYGEIAWVNEAARNYYCGYGPHHSRIYGASARDITDEYKRIGGDLSQLSPCPAPRRGADNRDRVPAQKGRVASFVRIKHVQPFGTDVIPGSVMWTREDHAVPLLANGRAKIFDEDIEKLSVSVRRNLATAPIGVGPGQFGINRISPEGRTETVPLPAVR
jgi:hypothetical protein